MKELKKLDIHEIAEETERLGAEYDSAYPMSQIFLKVNDLVEAVQELQSEEKKRQEHYNKAWAKGHAATEYRGGPRYTIAELRQKVFKKEPSEGQQYNEYRAVRNFLDWLEQEDHAG